MVLGGYLWSIDGSSGGQEILYFRGSGRDSNRGVAALSFDFDDEKFGLAVSGRY